LLLLLTLVTGLVDAVSYLKLGHIFVANMTGNVVFLGFAVADAEDFSILASLAAIAAFLIGALIGGRLGSSFGRHRGRLLAIATAIQIALVGAAFLISALAQDIDDPSVRYPLIALLAIAMGIQNASARRLAVPDLTTTVLTLTLTGFAADSPIVGGKNPNPRRRLLSTGAMFLGAAIGAVLVLHNGIAVALALVLALLVVTGISIFRFYASEDAWTTSPTSS
jgi:uncharacterized membrane protein YoaK (UPF0700 family)